MSAPVAWQADGTPRSTLFDDIYRSVGPEGQGGLAQSRQVFLGGCLLLADTSGEHETARAPGCAWSGQTQWQVLETGFGLGLNFLATWQAWRADPHRPTRLFFTSIEAWPVTADDIRRSAAPFPELAELAETLAGQWRGLLPGVHRLVFEHGQVQLTLCIGTVADSLPALDTYVDSVFLDGFSPAVNPEMWGQPVIKGIARLCRPGTLLGTWTVARAVRDALTSAGFSVEKRPGLPPKRDALRATFAPHWQPRVSVRPRPSGAAGHAVVVGAGLSGSAVAFSLAQRGWTVEVLDRAAQPAAGASGLPVGLVAPHVSPDDSLLSRLSRAGVALTLQRLAQLLPEGVDWARSGVLEHRIEGKRALPSSPLWTDPASPGSEWSRTADAEQRTAAGLSPEAAALWHAQAAWLRPAQLVRAQLQHPRIRWRGTTEAAGLHCQDGQWQVLDGKGSTITAAPHLVLASGWHTLAILQRGGHAHLPLNALRGQVSWGLLSGLAAAARADLPPWPVNGHGSFISGVHGPVDEEGPGWFVGSTFERGATEATTKPEDQLANQYRLERLLPDLAQGMQTAFGQARAWAAVRCTLPDRVPAVGAVDAQALPGLMVCAGMGARGLTLSVLCGELIAAQLHGEPWPVERKIALALAASRFRPRPSAQSFTPAGHARQSP